MIIKSDPVDLGLPPLGINSVEIEIEGLETGSRGLIKCV